MPVQALQHIKRMRGGANAHLMSADDDAYYVVKFRNNPQHTRILVNELICYTLLEYLGLPAPGWDVVNVSRELIERTPELTVDIGPRERSCDPGLHFGSRFPVDPARQAVYDYVPLSLLREVVNRDAFLGMLAFDKWVSNADGRQAIFFRDRAKTWLSPRMLEEGEISPRSLVYVANMIDHGFAFNAHHWQFTDLPEQGLYGRRGIYAAVQGYDAFEPWLDRIANLPAEVLDDAFKRTPTDWFDGEWDRLEALLEELYARRSRVPEMIWKAKNAAHDPFPNWVRPGAFRQGAAAGRGA